MNQQTLNRLYQLKGELGSRFLSIEDDLNTLAPLASQVETKYYEGYIMGQMDTLKRVREDVSRYLESTIKTIKEAENAEEKTDLPF